MDWRISSLGLLFDGLSFLSPLGLGLTGLAWYSDESFAVQAIMVSTGLFLTVVGLLKRGEISVASSEAVTLAVGISCFLYGLNSPPQLWLPPPSVIVARSLAIPPLAI